MKVCPACRTTFDDSQNFCLNDGTPLVFAEAEPETVVAARSQHSSQSGYNIPPVAQPQQPVAAKSNTGLIVAVTALVTILLVGVGIGGWWLLSRSNSAVTQSTNAKPTPIVTANTNSNSRVANAQTMPTQSANISTVTNIAPPTPAPTLSSAQAAAVREEVSDVVGSWKSALESNNINGHLSYYADSVDYYKGRYNKSQIRADKQRAFQEFDDLRMNISNLRVTPDAGGDKATVIYDKEWVFEGAERTNEGKVQSQLTLQKIGGRWLITGERDLKVYYSRSY